jgi:hypothetical protein
VTEACDPMIDADWDVADICQVEATHIVAEQYCGARNLLPSARLAAVTWESDSPLHAIEARSAKWLGIMAGNTTTDGIALTECGI